MDTPAPTPPRAVDAICDAFVEELAALDPITATEHGIGGHEDRLTDLSPDGFAARHELVRRTLEAATDADPVDERERAAKEAFLERLQLTLERYDAGVPQSEVSVISSGIHDVRSVFDLMDTGSDEGWRNVAARLAAVPATLDGYRATLRQYADAGQVSARRQYVEVAGQLRQWTGRKATPSVFATLVAAVPETMRAELERQASAATEAFWSFEQFLVSEMVPRARAEDAVGRDRYALASRYFLGARVDLEETYDWGWVELRRIEDEMQAIADQLVPGGSVQDAARALDADPARTIEGKEAFRDWMQEVADRAVDELGGTHFDIPEPARRIECCLAPTQDGGIYYTGPSEDFSRPGRMWWSVPAGIETFHPWRETTTVYHEGVPGHHLQVAQTTYRRELLNRWQRTMCWVSGSGEGWALYAERLMDELGYLSDPADRLGMLESQALRAARVVVDIGMHLQLPIPDPNPFAFHPGGRWTAELVYEFMRAHSGMDDATLRFEANRYLGWPGQAPSYKVGERLWLQAREDARARHGAAFDLKQFHRQALDLGSVGLDPLTRSLARL